MALATGFAPALQCGSDYVVNAGSQVFFQNLPNTGGEGRFYTIATAAAAAGVTQLTLNISSFTPALPVGQTASVTLYPGQKLYFGAGPVYKIITVDGKVTLTGNTTATVPVQLTTDAMLVTDTAETWAMASLLLPTNIPITRADTMVEGTNLKSGLLERQDKVSVSVTSQITCDMHLEDDAYWKFIHPLSGSTCKAFCAIVYTGGEIAWGPATVANRTREGAIKEKARPSFQLMWQDPFANPAIPAYLSATDKAIYDRVARLVGV
jgi:hypothetical protein